MKRLLQLIQGWPRHRRLGAQPEVTAKSARRNNALKHTVKIAKLPIQREAGLPNQSTEPAIASTIYSDHPDRLSELADSAYLCERQGRYAAAERLYKNVLALREQRFGKRHLCVATSLSDLATFYQFQNRYSEAHPLLQKALLVRRSLLSADHPDIAYSFHQLAKSHYYQRQYGKAEAFLQEALNILRRQLGADHLQTQAVYGDLMKTIAAAIEADRFDDLLSELPPLNLSQLSENYSWAKPVWEQSTLGY